MDWKDFGWRIKSLDDTGQFVGWASTYGNVDLVGDVIQQGAFAKTLQSQSTVPVLWMHRQTAPIGVGKLSDRERGLEIQGSLLMDDPVAANAFKHLKFGSIRAL